MLIILLELLKILINNLILVKHFTFGGSKKGGGGGLKIICRGASYLKSVLCVFCLADKKPIRNC